MRFLARGARGLAGYHRLTRAEYGAKMAEASEPASRDPHFLRQATAGLEWASAPTVALDASAAPLYRWFPDGEINASFNALDRHVRDGRGEVTALAYHSVVGGNSRRISQCARWHAVASGITAPRRLPRAAARRAVVCGLACGTRGRQGRSGGVGALSPLTGSWVRRRLSTPLAAASTCR